MYTPLRLLHRHVPPMTSFSVLLQALESMMLLPTLDQTHEICYSPRHVPREYDACPLVPYVVAAPASLML